MGLQDLDICISKLRDIPSECSEKCNEDNFWLNRDWCIQNCEARSTDINVLNECVKVLENAMASLVKSMGADPQFVYVLDTIIAKFRTLKSGDILLPDDINNINNAIRTVRDIIARIEELVSMISFIQPIAGFGIGLAYSQTVDPSIYYKPFNAFIVEYLNTNTLEVLENARDIKLQQFINLVDSIAY